MSVAHCLDKFISLQESTVKITLKKSNQNKVYQINSVYWMMLYDPEQIKQQFQDKSNETTYDGDNLQIRLEDFNKYIDFIQFSKNQQLELLEDFYIYSKIAYKLQTIKLQNYILNLIEEKDKANLEYYTMLRKVLSLKEIELNQLTQDVVNFFVANSNQLIKNRIYLLMPIPIFRQYLSNNQHQISEIELFKMLVNYCQQSKFEFQNQIQDLLETIHWNLLNPYEIIKYCDTIELPKQYYQMIFVPFQKVQNCNLLTCSRVEAEKIREKEKEQSLKFLLQFDDREPIQIDFCENNQIIYTGHQISLYSEPKKLQITLQRNYQLLMKLSGDTFHYSSEYWTTNKLLNENSVSPQEQVPAKFDSFNNLKVTYLKIIDSGSGRYSEFELETPTTLLSLFQSDRQANFKLIGGCSSPTELIGNFKVEDYKLLWRLNSINQTYNFRVRIGGYYHHIWGQYGADDKGFQCSAEMAGVGLEDQAWSPFIHAKKSFGIRAAHDFPTTPDGKDNGQLSSYGLLYGC